MRIYIPTRGRVDRQITWDGLPLAVKDKTVLVCPEEEAIAHRRRGRNVLICPVESIVRKRQWLFDNARVPAPDSGVWGSDTITMIDDDLIFLRRISSDAWNLRKTSPGDIEDLFATVEELLECGYAQVGLSARQGNNHHFPAQKVTCGRVTNFHAYFVPQIRSLPSARLDTFPNTFTMEDFHITLCLLEAGLPNAIITDFAYDQPGSNHAGGCALYRNAVTQQESAELLYRAHPNTVKVVTKQTKGGWNGVSSSGLRTDVIISWKKAYEMGKKICGTHLSSSIG